MLKTHTDVAKATTSKQSNNIKPAIDNVARIVNNDDNHKFLSLSKTNLFFVV